MTITNIAMVLSALWAAMLAWASPVPDNGDPADAAADAPEQVPLERDADPELPTEAASVDASGTSADVLDAAAPDPGVSDVETADASAVAEDSAAPGDSDANAPDAEVADSGRPSHVDITWMSISNVYYELGAVGILTDGYITRIPLSNFFGGAGGLASTRLPNLPNVAAVTQVLNALGGPSKVDLLLTGHSHFDHSFDTATWSSLTGAPIIGSRTTCYQALAQAIPSERCTTVVGGEKLVVAEGITMRVVRWNHSGDSVSNPEQHNPVELSAVPVPDPVTGGLHAGVAEDFPNGGGGRAFLFTFDGADGPISWFFQNSVSLSDINTPIVVDGVDYGAPIENLKAAMSDAGLSSVDLWIGTGGASAARLLVPILKPKAYLPIHWDGLEATFLAGVPRRYSDASLATFLTASGVKLLLPVQYMDKWRLDRNTVEPVENLAVKQALGFK